jgi:hypothetical protein
MSLTCVHVRFEDASRGSSAFQRAKPPSYDVEKTRFRAAVVKGLKWPRSQVLLSYFTDTLELGPHSSFGAVNCNASG